MGRRIGGGAAINKHATIADDAHLLPGCTIRKGASIYDVRTEGGRGVSPKEDVVREVA